MSKGFVIAIDGPVASGKGSLAAKLAKDISGFYLYTGAMYRCIALMCIERGINLENPSEVEKVLPDLNIDLKNDRVLLQGVDVTERINQPDTASGASVVGVIPQVRWKAVKLQQVIAEKVVNNGEIVVAEGRDTGTTVFPQASLKIYLTARPEIRARRRMEQFGELDEKGLIREMESLKIRDKRDTTRATSPLPDDPESLGYFVLDNSELSEQETIEVVKKELIKKNLLDPERSQV